MALTDRIKQLETLYDSARDGAKKLATKGLEYGAKRLGYELLPEGREKYYEGALEDLTKERDADLDKYASRVQELEALNQELKGKVGKDQLTGLPNRTLYKPALEKSIARANREIGAGDYTGNLTAIIFDIDHFKNVNDTYGHGIGDDVIREVAQTIEAKTRGEDSVYRIGGEEFVMLVLGTEEEAYTLAERVRTAVGELTFSSKKGELQVTISSGIASYEEEDNAESFFNKADQALYHSKTQGRNRVTQFSNLE